MPRESRQNYTYYHLTRALAVFLIAAILIGLGVCSVMSGKRAFKTVDKGEYGGYEKRKNYVITDIDDWKRLWNASQSTPDVDFTQKMVIAVFQGVKKSGSYGIKVSKLIETENALEVFVKETFPRPGSIVTFALTSPYHIIETRKIAKTVVFKHARNKEIFDVVTPKLPPGSYASGVEGEARKELDRMGIEYSAASFLENSKNNNTDVVILFLKAGMYPDVEDEYGMTALMNAAADGSAEILDILIDAGSRGGWAPLLLAADNGQTEIVQVLLKAGIDVNAKAYGRETPLIVAARKGHTETVKALIDAGADVEAKDHQGATAVVLAASGGHARPACEGFTETVRALLDAGADANAKFQAGGTALVFAAYGGCEEMVRDLLGAGADMNAKGERGETALSKASQKGHTEIAKELIGAGADVNVRDDVCSQTVLHQVARQGNAEIGKMLIEAGADLNAADFEGSTPLIHTMRAPNKGRGHVEIAKALIHAGADVNARERWDGVTALMLAAGQGNTEIAQALLEAGADINARDRDGRTPLVYAEERGSTEIVQLLRYGRLDEKSERSGNEAKEEDQSNIVDDTEWAEFEVKTVFDPTGSGEYVASIRLDGRPKIVSEGAKFEDYEVLKIDGSEKCIIVIKNNSENGKVFCVGE